MSDDKDDSPGFGPEHCVTPAPDAWERGWWDKAREHAATLRVYNQHGRGQPYLVLGSDKLERHEDSHPPRWTLYADDGSAINRVPFTGPQLLSFCLSAALAEAGLQKTKREGKPPKTVVVRIIAEDNTGRAIYTVSRTFPVPVEGDDGDEGDEGDEGEAFVDLPGPGPDIRGYVSAEFILTEMLAIQRQLIQVLGGRPAGQMSGSPDASTIREALEHARERGRAEGLIAALKLRGGDELDELDEEPQLSPARAKLIEQIPGVADVFASAGSSFLDKQAERILRAFE